MARHKSHEHCKLYLAQRRRIKNKTQKLIKRIKTLKKETQDKILQNSPIGRQKEKGK